jgi:hypothetical protein
MSHEWKRQTCEWCGVSQQAAEHFGWRTCEKRPPSSEVREVEEPSAADAVPDWVVEGLYARQLDRDRDAVRRQFGIQAEPIESEQPASPSRARAQQADSSVVPTSSSGIVAPPPAEDSPREPPREGIPGWVSLALLSIVAVVIWAPIGGAPPREPDAAPALVEVPAEFRRSFEDFLERTLPDLIRELEALGFTPGWSDGAGWEEETRVIYRRSTVARFEQGVASADVSIWMSRPDPEWGGLGSLETVTLDFHRFADSGWLLQVKDGHPHALGMEDRYPFPLERAILEAFPEQIDYWEAIRRRR